MKKKNILNDRTARILLAISGFFFLCMSGTLIALLVEWNQGISHDSSDPLEIGLGFSVFYTICGLIAFGIRALFLANKSKIAIDSDEETMESQTILCPKCGKEMERNAKYCSECGYAFDENKDKANDSVPLQKIAYKDSFTIGLTYSADFHILKNLYLIILTLFIIALVPLIAFIIVQAPIVRTYTIAMIIIAVVLLLVFLLLPLNEYQSKKKSNIMISVFQDKITTIRTGESSTSIRFFRYQSIVKAIDRKNYYLFRYRGTKNNLHTFCLPKRGLTKETIEFLNTLIK